MMLLFSLYAISLLFIFLPYFLFAALIIIRLFFHISPRCRRQPLIVLISSPGSLIRLRFRDVCFLRVIADMMPPLDFRLPPMPPFSPLLLILPFHFRFLMFCHFSMPLILPRLMPLLPIILPPLARHDFRRADAFHFFTPRHATRYFTTTPAFYAHATRGSDEREPTRAHAEWRVSFISSISH